MARSSSEKCRLCSKLSITQAQERHEPKGTGCWDDAHCHQRRSYYRSRDRYNRQRRLQYKATVGDISQTEVVLSPAAPAALLYLYRERVDTPLHAVGAELWLGQEKKAAIEPAHCLGLTSRQVAAYLQEVLQVFSHKYEVSISKFAAQVELDPSRCPISPCPLHFH